MALYPKGWPIDEYDGREPVKLLGTIGGHAGAQVCNLTIRSLG